MTADNLLKVLRIIEEIPTEVEGIKIPSGEARNNLQSLLFSLRGILMSSLERSSVTYCRNLVLLLNQSDENKILECLFLCQNSVYSNILSELSLCTAVVRAVSAWSTSSFISLPNQCSNHFDNIDSQNIADPGSSSSNTLIALQVMTMISTQYEEFGNQNYFELFDRQMRLSIRFLSIINRNLLRVGVGTCTPFSGLKILSESLREHLLICCTVLNSWLSVPLSIPVENSLYTNNENHFIVQQQQQKQQQQQQQNTIQIFKAVYSSFLLIVEVWDLIIRSNVNEIGIIEWITNLRRISGNSLSNTENYQETTFSKRENDFLDSLEVSGIVPIGVQYLESGSLTSLADVHV